MSACLLGEKVRYDGDDRREPVIVEDLARLFDLVPLCPEVEAGFPVPREMIRLEGEPDSPRAVSVHSRADHTARMAAYARSRVEALAGAGFCGFLLKKNSPSCGIERVKLYPIGPPDLAGSAGRRRPDEPQPDEPQPLPIGIGFFARALRERFPDLPMMDEEMLREPSRAAEFIRRVYAIHEETS